MTISILAGEMAQCVKMPTTKSNDLSLIPRIHMMEGENSLLQAVLWPPSAHALVHTHNKETDKTNKCNFKKEFVPKCSILLRNKFCTIYMQLSPWKQQVKQVTQLNGALQRCTCSHPPAPWAQHSASHTRVYPLQFRKQTCHSFTVTQLYPAPQANFRAFSRERTPSP